MEQNQKNENESKCVLELYDYCDKGLYTSIKKILEDNDFSSRTLDQAFRKCMKNRRRERNEFHDSLNLILQYININFRNPSEDNCTIMMLACKISDVSLIDIIIGFDFSLNQTYPTSKIDLSLRDDHGRNFLHYLINKENLEEEAVEVFEKFFSIPNSEKGDDIPEEIENGSHGNYNENLKCNNPTNANTCNLNHNFTYVNITQEINSQDNEGYTPLGLSLIIGWVTLSKKFLQYKCKLNLLVKASNNNHIHLAVLGKNINCIKLVLIHSTIEDLKHKNKDGLTPKDLAKSLKLNYYAKIIENFEENCLNPSFISIFTEMSIGVNDILRKFYLEDYEETLFLLNQLKVNQSILSNNSFNNVISSATNNSNNISNNNNNYNIEWNIFLTKYYIKLKSENGHNYNELDIQNKKRFLPESILSKFVEKNEITDEKKNIIFELSEFFEKIKTNERISDEDSKDIDVIIYNKGIFYYKLGDFVKTISIFCDYLKYHLGVNDTMYYKWFLYVNISFILIEGLINLKHTKFANCIIEKIEEFLFTHYRTKKDEIFTSDLVSIRDYLNYKEIVNQFSPTWDESFCFLNLLKALKSIKEVKMDECKNYMKEFKKLYKQCTYKDDVKVISSMHMVYTCLKINMFYCENSFSKCFKNLNKISKHFIKDRVNIRINDQKFEDNFNENEYVLFYYNSMGIINLKQKKFQTAEIFFKASIAYFKKVYQKETSTYDFSIRLEWIYNLKYNLGLCFFYQKKYEKALNIFSELSKNKNMSSNIFLWYRLGVCQLEVELLNIKKCKINLSDVVNKIHGYVEQESEESAEDENDNNADLNLKSIEDELRPKSATKKRIILHFPESKGNKKNFNEAVKSFKQILILSSENINLNSKLNEDNNIFELYNFYNERKTTDEETTTQNFPIDQTIPKIKSLPQILSSTYLNLIFCLTLIENWTEVLFYCEMYEKLDCFKLEKDSAYKIDNFKIEALINLRETEKAIQIIKSNINTLSNANDFRGCFYNNVNNLVYSDVSYKIVLNINLTKIHFINNNDQEAEKCIQNILSYMSQFTEIPPYIQNLIIYLELSKGNHKGAVNFIKFKKLQNFISPSNGKNK